MGKFYFTLPLIVIAGYFFGQWTCGRTTKKGSGFYITTLTFVILNLIHSVVDGMLLRVIALDKHSISLIAGHEIIRQPLMYFFYFTSTGPFLISLWRKISIGIFVVTGIWIMGISIGTLLLLPHAYLPDSEVALYTYAFFGGDILHHLIDYIKYKAGTKTDKINQLH